MSALACTAGFVSPTAWRHHYGNWESIQGLGSSMSAFIEGATRFVSTVGLPEQTARTLIAVVVVSFALAWCSAVAGAAAPAAPGSEPYRDYPDQFSLVLPDGWTGQRRTR